MLDNDFRMRDLLAFALRGRGLEVVLTDRLESAEAELGSCDGLLLDFHLGEGRSGAELARKWAGEGRLPPFWLVTGDPEQADVQGLRELEQLRGVVGKPFSVVELAEGVEGTLRTLAPIIGHEEAEPTPGTPPEAFG